MIVFEFEIERASGIYDFETAPCPEAYRVDCPESYKNEGRNGWYISFKDMSELMDFISREGDIIIGRDSITIYDDYVE
jgi:hypothetical protein